MKWNTATFRRRCLVNCFTGLVTVVALLNAERAFCQDPVYDASGAQYGRGFYSPLPFESIDTVTGNLFLSFSDLSLPGNGGLGLRVVRTYNSREGSWRIGFAGVPLRFKFNLPNSDLSDIDFITADGSEHTAAGPGDVTSTFGFWRFTKSTLKLELPNGWVATYGHVVPNVGGFLTDLRDPFDNYVTFTWQPNTSVLLSITQDLAGGQRVLTLGGWSDDRVNTIEWNGRTWTYEWETITGGSGPVTTLKTFTPPVPTPWRFTYLVDGAGGVKMQKVSTPNGAEITYTWDTETFPTTPAERMVVKTRTTGGSVPVGTWTFDWQNAGSTLVVSAPANTVTYQNTVIDDIPVGSSVTVAKPDDTVMQTETFTYESIPHPIADVPALKTRTLVRDGVTYTTTYSYSTQNFADYGQPSTIVESGQLSRTTTITYKHDFTKYIRGRVLSTTTTVNGEHVTSSATYNGTHGFLESSTAFGQTTAYAKSETGNVASVTDANGHITSFTYAWGVVKNPITSEYTITRTINSDGTLDSVSRGGVLLAWYEYEPDGRLKKINSTTPNRAPVTITYNVTNGVWTSTTTTFGGQTATTDLDGYGRAVHAVDGTGIHARRVFDAAGRQTYQSQPYGGAIAEVGTNLTHDALGRVRTATGPDGSLTSYEYLGTIFSVGELVTPTIWRTTTRHYQAFGDPSTARVTSLTDPNNTVWTYEYDNRGNLTAIDSAAGPRRTWEYNAANLLWKQTHPESGLTTNTYDNVGNLTYQEDARGPAAAMRFEYDLNYRLKKVDAPDNADDVTITYDARFDQPATLTNSMVQTTFSYDNAGRLKSKLDVLAGRTFVQTFGYDSTDNLTHQAYPITNRTVSYGYATDGRLNLVTTSVNGVDKTLASSFVYPPTTNGASFVFGNGQAQSIGFDVRQRPSAWTSGPLQVTYGYDFVDNVRTTTDVRGPSYSSAYTYDLLDRLTEVTGFGATSVTYNHAGDRLTAGGVNFHYNTQRRLESVSGTESGSFTYDAIGSLLSDPTPATYTYTSLNMLKTATVTPWGGGLPVTTTYKYGSDGQRVLRKTSDGLESYLIRGPGGPIGEYLAYGEDLVVNREYVYGGGGLLASFTPDGLTLPSISTAIVSPQANQQVPNGQTITLVATVSVPQGTTVLRVEYYRSGQLIGSSTNAVNGYPVPWNNQPLGTGTYTFRARLVTTDGHAVTSAPVSITVY